MRRIALAAAVLALAGALVASVGAGTQQGANTNLGTAKASGASGSAACKGGSVSALVAGKKVCLKAGLKCKTRYEAIYKRKGFHCANGRLQKIVKPAVSIEDARGAEGNSGTTNLSFTVSLSKATVLPVSVSYATADGTATASSDYQSASGKLAFAPGETSKTITVVVVGDTTYEPNETFTVTISNPVNASIGNGSATGTITNDDTLAMPGDWKGTTSQNELFAFTVTPDGANVTGIKTGQINESCNPDLIDLAGGNLDLGSSQTFPIAPDGTLNINLVLSGSIAGAPLTANITITGRFSGPSASGTFLEVDKFTYAGINFTCTSNPQTWNASHV